MPLGTMETASANLTRNAPIAGRDRQASAMDELASKLDSLNSHLQKNCVDLEECLTRTMGHDTTVGVAEKSPVPPDGMLSLIGAKLDAMNNMLEYQTRQVNRLQTVL